MTSALKVIKGNLSLTNPGEFTDENWIELLRACEAKTVESVLRLCFTWHELFEYCREEENEARFKDIYEKCGISAATASKRAMIGSNANVLYKHVACLPTGIEPLVGLSRIPEEQLIALLDDGNYITPELSREDVKDLKDDAVSAKASAKYAGDIIEYLQEKNTLPAPPGDEEPGAEPAEPAEKTGPSKKQKAKNAKLLEEQAAAVKAQAAAGKKKLKDIDYLAESLIDLVCVREVFDATIKILRQYYHPDKSTGSANDFNVVTAIDDVLGEHMVTEAGDED